MVDSRTLTALAGVLVSIVLSVALYVYTGSLLFFLFVPFVPFLFRSGRREDAVDRPPVKACSRCGFQTRDPDFEYCPRDGSRLYEADRTGH
jgi:hypothetical protein